MADAMTAAVTAAGLASYRISLAEARIAAKLAELAAWAVPTPTLPAGYIDASATLEGDGETDDTAALQGIIDACTGGETVYLPPGTYRIDGPIVVPVSIRLVGAAGTIIDCSQSESTEDRVIFALNPAGSLAAPLTGMVITGIEFTGTGIWQGTAYESPTIAMIQAWFLDGFEMTYSTIRDHGFMGLGLNGCTDALIERNVFDNIYYTALGYGIDVFADCDRIVVRKNFFTTFGRHGISTGGSGTIDTWPKRIEVYDNYFENSEEASIDDHATNYGPYLIHDNVVVGSKSLVSLRGEDVGTIIENNVCKDTSWGVHVKNYNHDVPPETPPTAVQVIRDNTILNVTIPFQVAIANLIITDNVVTGAGGSWPLIEYTGDLSVWTPTTFEVTDNIYSNAGVDRGLVRPTSPASPITLSRGNVYLPGTPVPGGPVSFVASPVSPYPRQVITFANTTPGTPPAWFWDFGDGITSTEAAPAHQYLTPGAYPVSLRAFGIPFVSGYTALWLTDVGSGQTVYDLSANGHDGTFGNSVEEDTNDPSWYPAGVVLSSNGYIDFGTDAALNVCNGDFTLVLAVSPTASVSLHLMGKCRADTHEWGFGTVSGPRFVARFRGSGASQAIVNPTNHVDGTPYLLTMTRIGAALSFYVGATLVGTSTVTEEPDTAAYAFYIGRRVQDITGCGGTIHGGGVYPFGFSAQQVAQQLAAFRSRGVAL